MYKGSFCSSNLDEKNEPLWSPLAQGRNKLLNSFHGFLKIPKEIVVILMASVASRKFNDFGPYFATERL